MSNESPHVAVVYPHLPHYRYGVFRALENQLGRVSYLSDRQSRDGSIAVIPRGTFRDEWDVENIWMGPALWQRGLGRTIKRTKPDVLIFLGDAAHLSTWIEALRGRFAGRKVYFWTIGWHRPERGLRKFIRKLFYRIPHGLLLYGNHGAKIGAEMGVPQHRMTVVYNSYESKVGDQCGVVDLGMPRDGMPTVGAVIRLSSNKGLEEIVRAVAVLRDRFSIKARCLIVGEGPMRIELTEEAHHLGVELYLPGAMYGEEQLAQVYRMLDVTVVPRAAGLTVLQSLAAKTPVVTVSDPDQQMPEFEAIVDGVNGALVGEACAAEIASALARLLTVGDNGGFGALDSSGWLPEQWTAEGQARRIAEVVAAL